MHVGHVSELAGVQKIRASSGVDIQHLLCKGCGSNCTRVLAERVHRKPAKPAGRLSEACPPSARVWLPGYRRCQWHSPGPARSCRCNEREAHVSVGQPEHLSATNLDH